MGVREARRESTTAAILGVARQHLAVEGAEHLSLRAVARDLDLSVSALYRYYRDRDALLTALVAEAFNDCANAVEMRTAAVAPAPLSTVNRRLFRAAAVAYRDWARANPSRFLLVFGTPVRGYNAPAERTYAAGTRIPRLLMPLLADAPTHKLRLKGATRRGLTATAASLGVPVPPGTLARGMAAWDAIHGHVMLELSGQFGTINGDDGLFDVVVDIATGALWP